ncbi:MAG TPA: RDD family protein [Ktedonobacterales bacterium]
MVAAQTPHRADESVVLAEAAQQAFWWRALALFVDAIVLSVVTALIDTVFGVTHVISGTVGSVSYGSPPSPPPITGFGTFTSSNDVGGPWIALITIVYFIGLEALFGATVGKLAARLRVVNLEGELISPWQSIVRNLLRVVDNLPSLYLLGGGVALFSPPRQRIGDRLAHTIVLPRYTLAAPLLTDTQRRRRLALVGLVVAALLLFCGGFYYFGRPPLVVASAITKGFFDERVNSYTLGAPVRTATSITYPITYTSAQHPNGCSGILTLRWAGIFGWEVASSAMRCR